MVGVAGLGAARGPGAAAQEDVARSSRATAHTPARFLSTNFQVDANVAPLKDVISRAHAAGFNGAVVTDVKLGRLDDGSLIPRFYTNLQDVLSHAAAWISR